MTIYSSSVTVIAPADQWPSLQAQVEETITNLFIHYRDGQLPPATTPAEETPPAEAPPAGEAAEAAQAAS